VSTDPAEASLRLPERPNLRHLKNQAKDVFKTGGAASLTEAQFELARSYGFASWAKLKAHVGALEEVGQLKLAIDSNDLRRVKALMTRNPVLQGAPLGYGKNGPLTWVAECRVPWETPSAKRLAMAEWMIENGSDVHQGGDGPLMRAALFGYRIPMMELLVGRGADVNALWSGYFPILFAPCETVEPEALKWLLEHGADPNCPARRSKYPGTALDYVITTYGRSKQLGACMDILLRAGGTTKYDSSAVLDLLRGRLGSLAEHLDADPRLAQQRFPELDFGATGARRLTLRGGTLLHVAAEYGNVEAARLLLDRGADINARATVDEYGVGGQTPIFHAVTQYGDWSFSVGQLLVDRGADLTIRVKLPGHYERADEFVECTPLGYARLFPGGDDHSQGRAWATESKSAKLLREHGAVA